MSFGNFLKQFDKNLYNQYCVENFVQKKTTITRELDFSVKVSHLQDEYLDIFANIKTIEELEPAHPARLYIKKRMIPEKFWDNMYFVPKFFKWASKHTDKFTTITDKEHPRLVMPWYDENKMIIAYSARAFGDEEPKYYTINLREVETKAFGLDRLIPNKPVIVLEGPIDSLFLPNAVAVGTSALWKYPDGDIYLPDSDVRNKEVMKIVYKLIKDGKTVCMLPNDGAKDINEMIQSGLTTEQILDNINKYTFKGLEAELKFGQWSKVKGI